MKKLKQLFTVFCAMVFMIGTSIPTYATGTTRQTGSITIENHNTSVSMKGHTYSVYKVFDVTSSGEAISYTLNDAFTCFFFPLAKDPQISVEELDQFAQNYIQNNDKYQVSEELHKAVIDNKIAPTATSDAATGETVTIAGLDLGYYLVVDNGDGTGEEVAMALTSMTTTNADSTINLKADAPTIDKEILHNDDLSWGNVGDNQIGDDVEYRFISTVPNTTGYEGYKYTIHDTMSPGLTFNNDVVIYLDQSKTNKLDPKYYTVTMPGTETEGEKCTFEVNINIIAAVRDNVIKAGDKLYTHFTAELNENAVVAGQSNDNKVDLEYSNNPNDDGNGELGEGGSTTTTPEDTVRDYTFQLNVLKTQNDTSTPLEGAEFEIQEHGKVMYFKQVTEGKYVVCTEDHEHATAGVGICSTTLLSPADGKFAIIGLDDETLYTIVETKAPAGFNPIDPVDFTIKATYDAVTGEITEIKTTVNGIFAPEGSFELGTTIVNTSDALLPETGGIGTTIFTVLGSGLMIFAAVVLIRKRRVG